VSSDPLQFGIQGPGEAGTNLGSVWIASDEQLFEAHGSRCDLVTRLGSAVRSVYREPSGALWLGTHELINGEPKSVPLPVPAQPVQYQYVHAMTSDASQSLWVSAVDRGLLRLHDGRWEVPGSGFNLPDGTPTTLWTDAAQRQWVGYSDGTAALRAEGSTRVFGPDQGLRVGPITVIRGSPAEIFVAGEWRLARFDGRRFRTLSASRSDAFSGITGIIVRANGDSLLQGFQGLMFRLEAVRQLLPERPGEAVKSLDCALEAADQAIGEGRDAVQNLRSSTFDDRDLPVWEAPKGETETP
jgi:hypothetical protein